MSYGIEYNRELFFLEKKGKKEYFLFIREGDNNVFDAITNLRVKKWYFVEKGDLADIWKIIGQRGGYCEGGCLQRAKGWNDTLQISIEDYIKLYRSKLKNAKPLEIFLNKFTIEAYVYIKDNYPTLNEKIELLRKFIGDYNMRYTGTNYYYDKDKKQYIYTIKNYEELLDFLNNYPRGYNEDYISGFRIEKIRRH